MLTKTHKIGLMCGTFDPPHIGHLILAQTALNQLQLDQILFLPVGDPTHKTTGTSADHRLEMTQLAIVGNDKFEVSNLDAIRPEPHYTATLLPLIQQNYPESELWLLIGGDSLETFPNWHQPDQILDWCRLAVLPRLGYQVDIEEVTAQVPAISDHVDWLEGPSVQLSSTWLREQLASQTNINYLIPNAVIDYAISTKIYG